MCAFFQYAQQRLRREFETCNWPSALDGPPLPNGKLMDTSSRPFQVAIFLYQGVTALDAVGPSEVLSRMPNTEMRFVGKEIEPIMTEAGALLLSTTHTLAETPAPDLVLVPGGTTTPGQMVDDEVLAWLRKVHQTSIWTTSVRTGSLILAAAGIIKGLPATTHWIKMGVQKIRSGSSPELPGGASSI
jgi:putative intracellular protease/amidase